MKVDHCSGDWGHFFIKSTPSLSIMPIFFGKIFLFSDFLLLFTLARVIGHAILNAPNSPDREHFFVLISLCAFGIKTEQTRKVMFYSTVGAIQSSFEHEALAMVMWPNDISFQWAHSRSLHRMPMREKGGKGSTESIILKCVRRVHSVSTECSWD